jgi:alpha-glucosidase
MQWNSQPNAGFSPPNVTTWLPVAPNYQQQNVEVEQQDPASMLNLVHRLIELRRATAALNRGSYRSLDNVPTDCFVYLREYEGQKLLIALNFSEHEQQLTLPELGEGRLVLSTQAKSASTIDLINLTLDGAEGVIIELG